MKNSRLAVGLGFMLFSVVRGTNASACDFPPKELLEKPRSEFRDRYVNRGYRYSVIIPEHLTGYDVAPLAPLHGFGLVVGEPPQSYIDVNGESNSLEYKSPADAARKLLDYLGRHGKKVESSSLTPAHLGRLSAIRLLATYTCAGSEVRYVKASTIALSPDKSTLYEVSLYALAGRYERDRAVLDKLLKSWRYRGR